MDTDENLLYGVLAVQLNLITTSQFADACAVLAMRPNAKISTVLEERQWVSSDDRVKIEELLRLRVSEHSDDVRQALSQEASPETRNAIRDAAEAADARGANSCLCETLIHLKPPAGYIDLETIRKPKTQRSHYTLTHLHGKGGLGQVWRARDQNLNREVALKEILKSKSDPESLARFIKEAQITGQLEHPNIIPVYELESGDSVDEAFYAMRYIRGETLLSAIKRYHDLPSESAEARTHLTGLLTAFVSVCNAIAYAHSRGVIHRDLKPANIMLGGFGEISVIDWGLARLIDQPPEEDVEPVLVTDLSEEAQTMHGQVVGTMAYMPPEQAAGRLDLLDARTDVYSLGAILYRILTGDTPNTGTNTIEVLDSILNQMAPPPRHLNSSVSPALEAVCLHALKKKRAGRYQSADALGADIVAWLSDEPVSVYKDSLSVRLARWVRRNRTWAQSLGAALVIVAVVSTTAAVLVGRARDAEAVALAAERVASREANQRFRDAREAIDTSVTGVSSVLQYFPGTQELRTRLLEKA